VTVDKIGDPAGIMSGTTRLTKSPTQLYIAKLAAQFISESPYFADGFSFQTGAVVFLLPFPCSWARR
jgi:citrate lyase subunit alpha/citrate CoA-transferase